MAEFDPASLGAIAVEEPEFDPVSLGAVPVGENDDFDPASLGAVPVGLLPEKSGLAYPAMETGRGSDQPPPEQVALSNPVTDAVRRVPSALAQTGATLGQGALYGADLFLPARPPGIPIGEITKPARDYLRDIQERAPSDYGVDPARDKEIVSKVIAAAANIPAVMAAGPAAPIAAAALMGESVRQDAELHGATPNEQAASFGIGAGVGLLSEALLGLPALLRSAKAAGATDVVVKGIAGAAIKQGAKNVLLREIPQEVLEQLAQNFTANTIVGYDPERKTTEGVGEAALLAGIVGGPVGATVQGAVSLDQRNAEAAQRAGQAERDLQDMVADQRINAAMDNDRIKTAVDTDLAKLATQTPEQIAAETTLPPETTLPATSSGGAIEPAVSGDARPSPRPEPTPAATSEVSPAPPAEGTAPAAEVRQPRVQASAQGEATAGDVQPAGGRSEGPGAAASSEFGPQRTTSTKNAVMEAERVARGADPVIKEARQTNEETLAKAESEVESNPNRGREVVEKLRSEGGDVRSISVDEEAVLLVEKVRLRNERDMQADRAADENATPEERAVAQQEWESLESQINDLDQATHASGATWGRFGQFRQRLLRDDYTFEAMERKARVQKGGALTPEESAKIKEQSARIAELEKQLAEKQKTGSEADATKASEASHGELEKEARKRGKRAPKDAAAVQRGIIDSMRKQAGEGSSPRDLQSWFQKLALNLIRGGLHGREPVIDRVHEIASEIFPDLQRNQTRDLISGFGDFKALDPEAAKAELRQIKQEAQQLAKIDLLKAREPLPKTGVERQTPSDEGRKLIKAVNEAKKKYGVVVTDPEKQLKSAQDAISTRLKNQLRDLAAELETGEKPSGKEPLQYSEENKVLQALRDRVKETLDSIAEKPELTPEQRVLLTEKALERLQEHYEGMIRRGEHTSPKADKPTVTSAKIEAAKARVAELKEEVQLMRMLDEGFQQAREQARLERVGDDLLQRLAEGDAKKSKGLDIADTPEMAALREKNDAMRAALAEMKAASPEAKAKKLEAATKAVEASIPALDRQIGTGDVAAKSGGPKTDSPALETLRAERDALRKYRDEMRRALLPKRTPEEIALQAYKTRTANRIAELQDKIARGDFAPKAKPKPVVMDKEATDLAFQIEKVKEQYLKDRFAYQLANRSLPKKILGGIQETLNTARALVTSFDLSAVLRQGGFIALGHPVRAAQSIMPMLRAFASEKGAFKVNQEIAARPNAPLYRESKLYLADQNTTSISKMEEAFMGRWAGKIPLVSGSGRAYTTFLNKLRADTFDAMAASLSKGGKVTPDEAKAISNFINVATGRGDLGKFTQSATLLNSIFFAPRYVASRFQLLAGQPLYGGTARTRAAVAKEYGRFLVGAGVVYALAMAAQDKDDPPLDLDPTSADFLKIRFGNTRLDPMSGLLQVTVFATREGDALRRFLTQSTEKKPKYGSGSEVLARFLRSKLNPAIGSTVNALSGKNIVGQKATPASVAVQLITPISVGDILKAMQEQGMARGTALALLSIFGMGVQTYEEKKPKK